MSVESLKKYGKLCSENEEVRKKAKEIGVNNLDGQAAYAKSLGLEFSKEDFAVLAQEAGLDGKNEISDEDLKKVAGGFGTTTAAILVGGLLVGAGIVAGGSAASAKVHRW
jgi:predicted ribosomally synthesized peptide with nif11-like leader